jgi:transketolase N-terminal domain/subunit
MSALEQRVLQLSYKHKLAHIGSCLIAVNPIEAIYKVKEHNEPFILSSGHMGLALYCVLEAWGFGNAEDLVTKYGTHPDRDLERGIYASTGSLGHGIGLAVGMAIADKTRNVYVILSDGECAEGSVWESLRVAGDLRLENLRVAVICNGYGAYGKIEVDLLEKRLQLFYPTLIIKANTFNYPDFLQGQQAHYHVLTDDNAKELGL